MDFGTCQHRRIDPRCATSCGRLPWILSALLLLCFCFILESPSYRHRITIAAGEPLHLGSLHYVTGVVSSLGPKLSLPIHLGHQRQSLWNGYIFAIMDCGAKPTPNFGPQHSCWNPAVVTPIRVLALSGTLSINVSQTQPRPDPCAGTFILDWLKWLDLR